MGYLSCRAESSIATCQSISDASAAAATCQSISDASAAAATSRKSQRKKPPPPRQTPDHFPHSSSVLPHIRQFTYLELESATGNFSADALLGRGSHGAVYKAILRGGHPVAVKRSSRRHCHLSSPTTAAVPARDEVENEIEVLCGIHSPRLVNLIGFTSYTPDRRERLLVVEFMPNGTLYDLLHSNPHPPGWARRLRLALQTAKALLTLHTARPPVIHRDVKSANVLIDQNFNARLGDFGLALRDDDNAKFPSARSTPPAGTLGYLDPAYVTPDNLSTKTDVFSFGILLLEIMSGRKAIDVAHSPPSVVEWAVPLLRRGKVSTLFDPRIAPPKDPVARKQLASLAASCVRSHKEMRPSMQEVVEQLKELSKTVPSRAWNGLSVGNPCSVVDVERTPTKLNSSSIRRHQSLNLDSRIRGDEEPIVKDEELPISVKKPPLIVRESRSLRARKVLSDETKASRNLLDLMALPDAELVKELAAGASGNNNSHTSKATLRVLHRFYDNDATLQIRKNEALTRDRLKSVLRSNETDILDAKDTERTEDAL